MALKESLAKEEPQAAFLHTSRYTYEVPLHNTVFSAISE